MVLEQIRSTVRSVAATAPLSIVMALVGCADVNTFDEDGDIRSSEGAVIWGGDDRLDYYEAPADQRALASSFVGVMLPRSSLDRRLGRISGVEQRTRRAQGYCDSEPYLDQPLIGDCSGTLIDGHLFATAGHCMGTNTQTRTSRGGDVDTAAVQDELRRRCAETAVVFNHVATGPTSNAEIIDGRDIYYCHEVLVHSLVTSISGGVVENAFDITIFSLKRSPSGSSAQSVFQPHGPAPVLANPRQPPFRDGARGIELLGIGAPAGMPLKLEPDGPHPSRRGFLDDEPSRRCRRRFRRRTLHQAGKRMESRRGSLAVSALSTSLSRRRG